MEIEVEKVDINGYKLTFKRSIGDGHSNVTSLILAGHNINDLMNKICEVSEKDVKVVEGGQ